MKDRIINDIMKVEGGYTNNPDDSGGETMFGITSAVARSYGYAGSMFNLPREVAFDIYADKYWNSVRGDSLVSLSEPIAEEVVDTAINMGPWRAATFLQRALNVFNHKAGDYADIKVDGQIGTATVAALQIYLVKRDEITLVKMLNCLQGAFYVELAEKREKDESFIYGWFKNRVKL